MSCFAITISDFLLSSGENVQDPFTTEGNQIKFRCLAVPIAHLPLCSGEYSRSLCDRRVSRENQIKTHVLAISISIFPFVVENIQDLFTIEELQERINDMDDQNDIYGILFACITNLDVDSSEGEDKIIVFKW